MSAVPLALVESPRKVDQPAQVPAPRVPRRVAIDPPAEKFLAEPVPLANYDRSIRAAVSRASRGIAWPSLVSAWADWYWHLASAPGKQMELASKAQRKAAKYALYALEAMRGETEPCIDPLPQDRRFVDPAWQQPPFNLVHQGFLLMQQWIWNATNHVAGVSRHHERMVTFTARQMLDVLSPTNFLPTNPEAIARTMETGGMNLVQGAHDWWRDALAGFAGKPAPDGASFRPGHEVAVTPGKVVLRNDLIELIQYSPATKTVYAQPMLIVPSPILKYYILDLSPGNSMVRHLVEQGHTVFMLSWRNPDARDRELGVDHYMRLGIRAAIDAVSTICGGQKVHAVGYCLGGTFLAMLAASMAGAGDERIGSLTLLAAEVDFTEAGRAVDLHRRQPAGVPRRHDVGTGLPRRQADGGRVHAAQLERPAVVAAPAPVPDGRAAEAHGPHRVERRHDAPAAPDAHRVPAQAVPEQRPGVGPVPLRRPRAGAERHPRADLPRRHRARPRGAVAVRVHDAPVRGHGHRVLPHQRRAQRRHRQSAGDRRTAAPLPRGGERRQANATSTPTSGSRGTSRRRAPGGRRGSAGWPNGRASAWRRRGRIATSCRWATRRGPTC